MLAMVCLCSNSGSKTSQGHGLCTAPTAQLSMQYVYDDHVMLV